MTCIPFHDFVIKVKLHTCHAYTKVNGTHKTKTSQPVDQLWHCSTKSGPHYWWNVHTINQLMVFLLFWGFYQPEVIPTNKYKNHELNGHLATETENCELLYKSISMSNIFTVLPSSWLSWKTWIKDDPRWSFCIHTKPTSQEPFKLQY